MICQNAEDKNTVMWYATQARDAYPYYEHTAIGYNYRMSNICAGIGRGQMTVADAHIAHHKHVQALYEELLKDVVGVHIHKLYWHTGLSEDQQRISSFVILFNFINHISIELSNNNAWITYSHTVCRNIFRNDTIHPNNRITADMHTFLYHHIAAKPIELVISGWILLPNCSLNVAVL